MLQIGPLVPLFRNYREKELLLSFDCLRGRNKMSFWRKVRGERKDFFIRYVSEEVTSVGIWCLTLPETGGSVQGT